MPEVASPATSFLGRECELAEGERLLRESLLLTITGPGGAGKTRFALELARRVEGGFSGGSTTCLFASLRDSTLVLPTIAWALEVREQGGRDVRELLAEREALEVVEDEQSSNDSPPARRESRARRQLAWRASAAERSATRSWEAELAAGAAMTLDEAVAYALGSREEEKGRTG